jgi:hypothetical protein
MLDTNIVIDAITSGATGMLEYLINFGGELQVIETVLIFIIAPAIGILISIWGVWDLIQLKKRNSGSNATGLGIVIKFCVGPATIQLVLLMKAISESIFGERHIRIHEGLATSYVDAAQAQQGDPVAAGLLIIVAFLVIVGWISALRSMMAFARMGNPQENGYQLFRAGSARLIAATFLCMFQFFMDDMFETASGQAGQFSSSLNLPNS